MFQHSGIFLEKFKWSTKALILLKPDVGHMLEILDLKAHRLNNEKLAQ